MLSDAFSQLVSDIDALRPYITPGDPKFDLVFAKKIVHSDWLTGAQIAAISAVSADDKETLTTTFRITARRCGTRSDARLFAHVGELQFTGH